MVCMSQFAPEVQAQAKALGLEIAQNVRKYFADPQHRVEFEQWFKARCGKEYQWKPINVKEKY